MLAWVVSFWSVRFVRTEEELEEFRRSVKLRACQHCGAHETLNAHGFLRGYGETGSEVAKRGRRFFCSNRGRRAGCGRTFSVSISGYLPRFSVLALALWSLLRCAVKTSLFQAARLPSWSLSLSSAYRLKRLFEREAPQFRGWLFREKGPPEIPSRSPLTQLLAHFADILGPDRALTEYHWRAQTPLFP